MKQIRDEKVLKKTQLAKNKFFIGNGKTMF